MFGDKSSVYSLKRDHDYYQAQQQIHTTGSDYLDFLVVALKVKLIYMKGFAMMSSMIILKSKQDVKLAKKVRNNKMDQVVELFATAYASSLTLKNDPNIKLLCPDLIKCLKSVRMEQFPLLVSHRNLVIKISDRLVQVVSLEISLLSGMSHMN